MSYDSIKWGVMSFQIGSKQEIDLWPHPNIYNLKLEEREELQRAWKAFNKTKAEQNERYKVAIKRFNLAKEDRLKEDQIVDAMISFESIFSSSGSENIGYRLGRSLETLLGKTDSGYSVLTTMKAAYRTRNKIVHGEDINQTKLVIGQKEVKLGELFKIIMEWLRKALSSKLIRVTTGE